MSLEHLSYSSSQPETSPSPEIPQHYIAIFIDDIRSFSEHWAETFRAPNLRLRISPDNEARLSHFFAKFSDADLSKVVLVVVDQGYGWGETREFLRRVRTANPDVFILETTGGDEKKKFSESDAVFQNNPQQFPIRNLIKKSKGNIFLKIEKLKLYASPSRRKAQLADPYSEINQLPENDRFFDVQESLEDFSRLPMFRSILTVLDIDQDTFWNKFLEFSPEESRDALHHLWNLATLVMENSNAEDVSLTVQRATTLFKS